MGVKPCKKGSACFRKDIEYLQYFRFKGQVRDWYNCWLFKRLYCCEWCVVHFSIFSHLSCETRYFNLLRSAKWCHFDVASCWPERGCQMYRYYTTQIASLLIAPSHNRTKYKMATIFGLTYEDSLTNLWMKEASKHGKNSRLVFCSC